MYSIRQIVEITFEDKERCKLTRFAFGTFDRQLLWLILQSAGVPRIIINESKELYNDTESVVILNGQPSLRFLIRNGVRQD